jgi:hypothetical protein
MKNLIKFFFQHLGIKSFMSINAVIGLVTYQLPLYFSLINTYEMFIIMRNYKSIFHKSNGKISVLRGYIIMPLSFVTLIGKIIGSFSQSYIYTWRSMYFFVYNTILYTKIIQSSLLTRNKKNLLEGNILWPLGVITLIGKIIGSVNPGSIDIFDVEIKWVIILIIVGIIVNILWGRLHNKESSPKAEAKTKTFVPAPVATGATGSTGSGDSSSDSDDDKKNKSLWEKVKDFCYIHRKEIVIVGLAIVGIIIYGTRPKPKPRTSPKDEEDQKLKDLTQKLKDLEIQRLKDEEDLKPTDKKDSEDPQGPIPPPPGPIPQELAPEESMSEEEEGKVRNILEYLKNTIETTTSQKSHTTDFNIKNLSMGTLWENGHIESKDVELACETLESTLDDSENFLKEIEGRLLVSRAVLVNVNKRLKYSLIILKNTGFYSLNDIQFVVDTFYHELPKVYAIIESIRKTHTKKIYE